MEIALVILILILFGLVLSLLLVAGVFGVPFGLYRAWRAKTWAGLFAAILLISVPSAVVAYATAIMLIFLIATVLASN